jgi:heme/copper-type cytochrome/quinol oxidase subunit 4
MEANTLMSGAVKSYTASFLLKIVLPAILFIIMFFRMKKATDRQLRHSNFFITGALILYTFINISHLICFAILPIFILAQMTP